MRRLRKVVREYNVYRWAGSLIGDLCELRLDVEQSIHEKADTLVPVA
jgi:hypothetical protein